MVWLKSNYQGIIVSLCIAIAASFFGNYFTLFGGAIFGILIGIGIGNITPPKPSFTEGINFTSKKILQWAVIILGSGLSLRQVYATGVSSVVIILVTITAAFITVFVAGRMLKVDFNLKSLIGVGRKTSARSSHAAQDRMGSRARTIAGSGRRHCPA